LLAADFLQLARHQHLVDVDQRVLVLHPPARDHAVGGLAIGGWLCKKIRKRDRQKK
jgi:hypothetical protein